MSWHIISNSQSDKWLASVTSGLKFGNKIKNLNMNMQIFRKKFLLKCFFYVTYKLHDCIYCIYIYVYIR